MDAEPSTSQGPPATGRSRGGRGRGTDSSQSRDSDSLRGRGSGSPRWRGEPSGMGRGDRILPEGSWPPSYEERLIGRGLMGREEVEAYYRAKYEHKLAKIAQRYDSASGPSDGPESREDGPYPPSSSWGWGRGRDSYWDYNTPRWGWGRGSPEVARSAGWQYYPQGRPEGPPAQAWGWGGGDPWCDPRVPPGFYPASSMESTAHASANTRQETVETHSGHQPSTRQESSSLSESLSPFSRYAFSAFATSASTSPLVAAPSSPRHPAPSSLRSSSAAHLVAVTERDDWHPQNGSVYQLNINFNVDLGPLSNIFKKK